MTELVLDRRRDTRASQNTVGAIRFGATGNEMPCTIVDLTPRGAGLIVASAFGIPRVFQLTIKGEPGVKYCRVIWAEGGKLGVTFE